MKVNNKVFFYFILSLLMFLIPRADAEVFRYALVCHDLHRGEMIVDPVIGAYHEYEMDDGYSGQINLIVSDTQVFIYKNNDLMVNAELTSDAVEIIGSSRIKVSKTNDEYFSFHLGRTGLVLIQHFIQEGKTFRDFFLECPNMPTIGNAEKLFEHIHNINLN
ncbi:hypothetical protein [Photobacterium sp. 1_MG-2023]|uniref:hypothetical protein n=1 Tax=Photobacterium sp. 1_MG-2023 TaxID=3062646 RepID=UPI0026E3DA75|nr:hypothetical protein [Photobacterium sp. 1_MG-2023]MDO6705821.1 hypothetical protein [Photobacterium sp. 1_MG-2023]